MKVLVTGVYARSLNAPGCTRATSMFDPCTASPSTWNSIASRDRIVTSRTWRQVPPARRRLDAETLRDQALAIAGLLDDRIGGPSVMPFQPDNWS